MRLITARDVAMRAGFPSVAEWMLVLSHQSIALGKFTAAWDGQRVGGSPLSAFVDFGRWAVACPCGQHSYADPDEPFLYCARCGNGNSGLARQVLFPPLMTRLAIEQALMERPVTENSSARDLIESARLARPKIAVLPRNWYPGQSPADLREMNTTYGGDQ